MRVFFSMAIFCMCIFVPALHAGVDAAGLEWEFLEKSINVSDTEKNVEIGYPFKNNGKYPIVITSVSPSCGCTTSRLPKNEYLPGEKGELRLNFSTVARGGKSTVQVSVSTDESAEYAKLVLEVNVLQSISVTPQLIVWMGAPAGYREQIVTVTTKDLGKSSLEGVKLSDDLIEVSTSEAGQNRWYIKLRPKEGFGAPARVTLDVKINTEKTGLMTRKVYIDAQ